MGGVKQGSQCAAFVCDLWLRTLLLDMLLCLVSLRADCDARDILHARLSMQNCVSCIATFDYDCVFEAATQLECAIF